jgi:hypothetical protein
MRSEIECQALAAKYRQLALEANASAAAATTVSMRDGYLGISLGWRQLADSVGGKAKPQ